MRACDRFEREGLLLLEQGLPLAPHFDACPDCREARAAYRRLTERLAAADAGLEPPPRWQAGVWAEIARRSEARRRRRRAWWLAPAGAAAALAAVLILRPGAPPAPAGLGVTLEPRGGSPAEPAWRGGEARPGDRLILEAATGGDRFAELRIYRDDAELVLRCSEEAPCVRDGDELRAAFELPAVGSYQPLLLVSDDPLPPPAAGLDADAGRALAAGARVELGDEVRVR